MPDGIGARYRITKMAQFRESRHNRATIAPFLPIDRDVIKQTVRSVVKRPGGDVLKLIVEELRRLHEGVLARYGLRASEFNAWKVLQRT